MTITTTNRYLNLSRYELLHLPAHLVDSKRTTDLVKLLTDEEFLEHKVESDMVSELVNDLRLTVTTLTPISPWHRFLKLICDAISRDFDFIVRHPSSLFQSLWNLCWWHDTSEAASHYVESTVDKSQGLITMEITNPKLHTWMEEWRNKKEGNPDFTWVRQYRPPVESLTAPLTKELKGHSYVVWTARFSQSGEYIISGSANTPGEKESEADLILWDARTGGRLRSLNLEILSAEYSHDSLDIVAASMDGSVHIIDARSFKQKYKHTIGEHRPRVATFSPDNNHIIVGCYDGTVAKLSVRSGELTAVLPGHPSVVIFAGYAKDGKSIVTASHDGTIQVWQADPCELRRLIKTPNKLSALAISRNAEMMASATEPEDMLRWTEEETEIALWDSDTGNILGKLRGHTSPVKCLAFAPDGKYLLSGAGTFISNQDNSACLWEIETGREIKRFTGHSSGVTSANFSSDGTRLATSSWDRTVRLWDVAGESAQPKLPNHTGDVFGLSFSPNGRWLVSSAWDDLRVLLWDAETGSLVHVMEGHKSLIRCFRFSDDSQYLVSGSGSKYHGLDCTVRLWHVETGRQLAVFEGTPAGQEWHGHVNPVKRVGFSRDGRNIISGHADMLSLTQAVNLIRVWDRYSGQLTDCFPGDNDEVYELTKSHSEEKLLEVVQKGVNENSETRQHALCGDLSNLRSIAAWETQLPVGLIGRNEEIVIRTFNGDVGWLPEQLGLSVAASRSSPRWAVGRGNNLVIFGLEGALGNLRPRIPSSEPQTKQKQKVDLKDLFEAISRGNLRMVRGLLAIEPAIATSCDSQGLTPLHQVAQQPLIEDSEEIALALLDGGADPNAGDISGLTPLHWLASRPWGINIAELLLEHGADPMAESLQGDTPLDSALRTSHMFGNQMVNLLNRYRSDW